MEIATWRAGAGNPQDRFHEATIVLAAPTWITGLAGQQRCDSLPLPLQSARVDQRLASIFQP